MKNLSQLTRQTQVQMWHFEASQLLEEYIAAEAMHAKRISPEVTEWMRSIAERCRALRLRIERAEGVR